MSRRRLRTFDSRSTYSLIIGVMAVIIVLFGITFLYNAIPSFRLYSRSIVISPTPTQTETISGVYDNALLGLSMTLPSPLFITNSKNDATSYRLTLSNYKPNIPVNQAMQTKVFSIEFIKLNNPQKLNTQEYLQQFYKNKTTADGSTAVTDVLLPNLVYTNVPVSNSYIFAGTLGENPIKEYIFPHADHVYMIQLSGSGRVGDTYSDTAEKIFDDLVSSITIK